MKESPKRDWAKGLNLAFRMSAWLIVPIVGASVIGNWLDEKYQSEPLLFLVSTGVAFIITCIGLTIEVRKHFKQIEKEDKNGN